MWEVCNVSISQCEKKNETSEIFIKGINKIRTITVVPYYTYKRQYNIIMRRVCEKNTYVKQFKRMYV